MEGALCVGDIVCLYSAESCGFIFSTQSSSVHNAIAVGSNQDRQRPDIQDQQVLSFELQVANRYKLNEEFRRLLVQLNDDPNNISIRNSVSKAKTAADSENEDNDVVQKRQRGKKVLYGQVIQLRHIFTNKYIHVSTTKTSTTEGNNMAVELQEENANHAQFKIMPRYKVRAEGDVVQVDDQIVLESVRSPGSYLHVSKAQLGKTSVYLKSHELNLSVQQSGFTVYRKLKPSSDDAEFVKAGDIVRFFHKEMEAYLVAEGLFNEDKLLEDVHLRLRPFNQTNPKSMTPSTSAVTYWQIEFQEGPIEGGIMKWGQQCKIIHMCSRKYLSLEESGKVNLTADHNNPRSVFRLHPVIREKDIIPMESYCRIEHVVTGHWLHALNEDYQRKREVKGDTASISSLSWSTATLKKIGTKEEQQYDDAFTIQAVSEELKEIFNYMAGMVPFVQKLVADKKDGLVLNLKLSSDIIEALSEIKDFMIENSMPVKKRQKLVRNLRIVDLMVNLLQLPFRGAPDKEYLTEIFVEAYDVLSIYLSGFSRKNELYMARFIDFFLSQFEYNEGLIGLNSVHMVMELIRDNRMIKDRITHDHIEKFVDLLHRDKNYRYLDLLSVLCACQGVTNADNQRFITEAWLNSSKKNCVFYTSFGEKIGKQKGTLYVSTNNKKTWVELHVFAEDNESDTYLFLQQQLELFSELCRGQNTFCIKLITKQLNFLTWEEAFTCLCDERLPSQLRAQYCHLINTMFMDVGDNHSVIDRVKLSFVYEDIGHYQLDVDYFLHQDSMDKSKSETYSYFTHLSVWIADFLEKNSDMVASEIGNNILVRQVLILVQQLVSFGFYHKQEDIKNLLQPLMSLIDGRNDKPYRKIPHGKEGEEIMKRFQTIERFEKSFETTAVVNAKYQALETLDLFLNLRYNFRMEKFMSLFKLTHSKANTPNVESVELGELLREDFNVEQNISVCRASQRKLQEIFDSTAFMREFGLVDVLKDLSNYDYDQMVRMSMHLLNRHFSAYSKLFERALQAQVLVTDKSVEVCSTLATCLPKLRRYAASELNESMTKELTVILDQLIEMCHLEKEIHEPHEMNQSILYNHGILRDLFSVLSQKVDLGLITDEDSDANRADVIYMSEEKYQGLQKAFEKTFILMKVMARRNKSVQMRLFNRIDLIMSKKGAYKEMAECLTEIFTANSTTCMKIADNTIRKIMLLIAKHRESVPQYVDLLNALVKVEELDVPLRRNQGIVMQYFMQFRADVAQVLDQDVEARKTVLTTKGHKDLPYLIALIDMLASCAEGENRFIESICQTIIKIPDLLDILSNPGITHAIKRPVVRFFLWVYLHTAGGMIESGAGELSHDAAMWKYIQLIETTMKTVTHFGKDNSFELKQLLKRPPARGSSIASVSLQSQAEQTRASAHYLFDGCMPFLKTFFSQYYRPNSTEHPDEVKQLDDLTTTFWEFMEIVVPIIRNEKQLKHVVGCMSTLLSASTNSLKYMKEFYEKYGSGTTDLDIRTDGRKAYIEYYDAEEQLNAQLRVFARNMKSGYDCLHTFETKGGGSEDVDYSKLGPDEKLPLGHEFQEHLRCFIDNSKTNSLEKYAMADKLVKQLRISGRLSNLTEKEKLDRVELDIKCLQLLRGLIHNEIVKLPHDWESYAIKHRTQLRCIENVQNALDQYGVVESIQEHINRPQDHVVREMLAFLATLLFNGNGNVQDSLITYYKSTREETFFFAMKSRMQMSAQATQERNLLHAMHQAKLDEAFQQAKSLKKALHTTAGRQGANTGSRQQMKGSRPGSVMGSSLLKPSNTMGNGFSSRADMRPMGSGIFEMDKQMGSGIFQQEKQMGSGALRLDTRMGSGAIRKGSSLDISVMNPKMKTMDSAVTKDGNVHLLFHSSKVAPIDEPEKSSSDSKTTKEEPPKPAGGDLEFQDDGYIQLVLRILGLMCDNQCHDIQEYLREQPDNIKSANLVAETTKFMSIIYSNINEKSLPLTVQLFYTLVEFTSGNQLNQGVVFDNKICDYVNFILRIPDLHGCTLKEEYILKKSIATLIRTLTEENPSEEGMERAVDKSKAATVLQVMEYLDSEQCVTTMTEAYHRLQSKDPEIMAIKDQICDTGFAFFHIICRKMDLDPTVTKEDLVKSEEHDQAWHFYEDNTLSIEIIKDGILQKIYFRVKDKKVLRDEIKDHFKYEVDRSSPSNKIRDFMDWASDIMKDIQYQRTIHSNPIGRLLVKLWIPMNYAVLILSILISLIITIVWRDPKLSNGNSDTSSYVPEFSTGSYLTILYTFGGFHNVLSLCVLVTFFLSNRPSFPPYRYLRRKLKSRNEDEEEYKSWHEKKDDSHLEVNIYSFKTFYYVIFFVFSILGTLSYGYFFAFHLLHIAELHPLLKRVIQAVTTNGRSLMMVGLLGLALFFCYSLIAFAFFRETFLLEASGRHCRTVGQCLVTMIHHGFVDSPYSTFEALMTVDYQDVIKITIFDVTFFILVTTIGLNIIFGIIVDTFSELRDSKWQIDKDMLNNCFICSRESYEFERNGNGFECHVKNEHNQWAYLFFFIHLDQTRPNDYSGLEHYVFHQLQENRYDFFPLNQALCLRNEEDANEITLHNMAAQLEYIMNKMKEEESEREREKETRRQKEWESKHRKQRS